MSNVSRPLVGLLVTTLAFFALWTVALKPGGSAGGGGSQGLHAFSSAISAAHHVAAKSAAASAAESAAPAPGAASSSSGHSTPSGRGGSSTQAGRSSTAQLGVVPSQGATTPATGSADNTTTSAAASAHSTSTPGGTPPAGPAAAAGQSGPAQLKAALGAHEVVLLLFFNPAGADDQAVKQELDAMAAPAGVLVLTAPITQLADYSSITGQVPVAESPTLLFIDRHGDASALTGFADSLEIGQRLAETLAVK